MTTSTILNKIMQTIPEYGGLYLYNQLKNINVNKVKGKFIVINYVTEEEANAGHIGHWVVLDDRYRVKGGSMDNKKDLYFFDSYGYKPDEPRKLLHLNDTHEIMSLIDRISNPYKYTQYKSGAMILSQPPRFEYNKHDFQVKINGDDTCGVYSIIYAYEPSFLINPVLNINNQNRLIVDAKLTEISEKAGVIISLND